MKRTSFPVMRACVVAAVTMTALAHAKPMMPPPITRFCSGPASWAQVAKCVKQHAPGADILAKPSKRTQLVRLSSDRTYLFVESKRDTWNIATTLDSSYIVVEQRDVTLAKLPALRIELRRREADDGMTDVVFEKIALICRSTGFCSEVVYACTVMTRGKAIETFLGEVVLGDDGSVVVTGDRSRSGPRCTNR